MYVCVCLCVYVCECVCVLDLVGSLITDLRENIISLMSFWGI